MRAEFEILLLCSRSIIDTHTARRLTALAQDDVDWDLVFHKALDNAILPLTYHNLSTTCPASVPGDVMERMEGAFYAFSARNLLLTGELIRILEALKGRGIGAVPFKGPVLAATAYGNLAFRQFGDLDIVVLEQDVLRAKGALATLGYKPEYELSAVQETEYLRSNCEYNFDGPNNIHVEIHWQFVPRHFSARFDVKRLFERRVQVSVAGTSTPSFAPEDLLLVLCAHGSKHYWQRLLWICDVAQLIRTHADLSWPSVLAQAQAMGNVRILSMGLLLAHDLLGAPLPAQVLGYASQDPKVRELCRQVIAWLGLEASDSGGSLQDKVLSKRDLFRLQMKERPRDKAIGVIHRLRKVGRRSVLPSADNSEII